MTRIKLTVNQIKRVEAIKQAGDYPNLSAVIGSLIAVYGDDFLNRLTVSPSVPLVTQSVSLVTQPSTTQSVPPVTQSVPNTTPSVPPVTQSVPSGKPPRVKFEI
jgi:hypothetical protein